MNEGFSQGDVVQLKSGGTKMTIEQVAGNDVTCVWFEGKQIERETFPAVALIKYKPFKPVVITRS